MKINRSHDTAVQPAIVLVSRSKSELGRCHQFGPHRWVVCVLLFCIPRPNGPTNGGPVRVWGEMLSNDELEISVLRGHLLFHFVRHGNLSYTFERAEVYKHDTFMLLGNSDCSSRPVVEVKA